MIWRYRFVGLVVGLALLGTPVVETVCAMVCAPTQALTRPATANISDPEVAAAAHHHEAAPPQETRTTAALDATRLSAPACDTHGGPDGELQARLTPGRAEIPRDLAVTLAPAHDHESFALTAPRHTRFSYSPPPRPSGTPASLVLRI